VISTRRWAVTRRALAVAAIVSILAPLPSGAQENDPPEDGDRPGEGDGAQIDLDIDVLRVDGADVETALGDLAENVAAQQAALDTARAALVDAEAALTEADAAVEAAQSRLDGLAGLTDMVVVDAYMNPPVEAGLEALAARSLTDASVKQSILNFEASSDAALLDEFEAAQAQLEIERAAKEDAAAEAADRQAEAEAALADLESSVSQEVQFILEVERRLDQRLSEAQGLAELDPALAARILAREAEVAGVVARIQEEARAEAARQFAAQLAQQAAERRERDYSSVDSPPGGLSTVSCPTGGSITIAGDIAGALGQMLDASAADGLTMCGNGYRDPQDQINVRRNNCGTSNYAIYEAPSSSCSPPTARPGTSMHEQGLAIDFTCGGGGTVSYGDACYSWLQSNAETYGFYNLPGEPWHYSVNGD
jgi:hypothetical protein